MKTKSWKKWAIGIMGILFAVFIVIGANALTASAEDPFKPDVTVSTAKELKEKVLAVQPNQETPYKIRLGADIILGKDDDWVVVGQKDGDGNSESDDERYGLRTGARNLIIDLNGHTMKREGGWWVISVSNIGGKLELIDTSADKTGLITNDEAHDVLVYNYGTLITNVNMTNPTYHDPNGYSFNTYAMIKSSTNPSKADVDNEEYQTKWTKKPSVTIEGGAFLGPQSGAFIELIDSNLTIKDISLSRDEDGSLTRSIFTTDTYAWSSTEVNEAGDYFNDSTREKLLKDIQDKLGKYLEAYKPYRGCEVVIEGGKFIGSNGRLENITLGSKVTCNIPAWYGSLTSYETDETYENKVTISGGTWETDYTTYCAPNMWMQPADEIGNYYSVTTIDQNSVVATVTADGDIEKQFSNFNAAWLYATRNLDGTRTIRAEQDAAFDQLNLWDGTNTYIYANPGTVTIDLNGKKLTYTDKDAPSINGSRAAIALENDGNLGADKPFKLIVKDGTPKQDGELIFNIASVEGSQSKPTGARGINIKNQYASFELQSGTIRQTGYFPNESSYTDIEGGNGGQSQAKAIFCIGENLKTVENAVVTIKGGNILSEIYFGTESEHGELTSSPVLVAWADGRANNTYKNINFQVKENDTYSYSFPNKASKFVFDLDKFIIEEGHTSVFSWDLKSTDPHWGDIGSTFEKFTYVAMGTSKFALTHLEATDNFIAGGERYEELEAAIEAAKAADGVVSFLRNATLNKPLELEDVTLDLDFYLGCQFTIEDGGSLTLKNGATLRNGKVVGDITAEGDATLQNVTVTGNITVKSGTLTIPSGQYGDETSGGQFNIEDGASAYITGGWFKGNQIETLDQYFAKTYGAYITAGEEYVDNTLYEVKVAPNLAAQEWYRQCKTNGKFEIATTDQWNYFAIYVSSGTDDFKDKTVNLTADLDFGYRPDSTAEDGELDFFPVGNQTYRFNGTFDGGGNTIEGVHVIEINAGLFGGTNSRAKISNITVKNSDFTGGGGVGYFDKFNTEKGWVFVGGIIAQGNQGNNDRDSAAENIKLENIIIGQAPNSGNIMGGGYIGQTWSNLYIRNIEINGITLQGNWKMGGIVGFTEASVTVENGSVDNFVNQCTSNYVGSVMGQLVGKSLTLDGCAVDSSDSYLVGGMDAGTKDKEFKIEGTGTDITAKGTAAMKDNFLYGSHDVDLEVTVPTTSEETQADEGFTLNFKEEEIPNDAYVLQLEQVVVRQEDGNEVTKSRTGLAEGEKIIAGKSATEFDEDTIAAGYGYRFVEGTELGDHYEVCEISVYIEEKLAELEAYKQQLLNNYTYSEEAKAELEAIYVQAEEELTDADVSELTMTEVRKLINSAKAEMDAVPILSAEEAQKEAELEQAKKDAETELKLYAASKGVAQNDKSVTNGLKAIGEAETTEDVATELDAAKKAVDAAKKAADAAAKEEADKQSAAAALAEAKKNAETELKLYAASKGVALEDESVTDGLEAIGDATDEQAVADALAAAKAAVDKAKKAADDAAKEEEDKQSAAAALTEAKKNAETELKLYAASNGVAQNDKSVTDGLKAIGDATDEQAVASALTVAKGKVDAAKKAADDAAKAEADKQSAAAALAEAKKNAETELKLYAANKGVSLEDKSVTDGLKAIGDATDEQAVADALTAAKAAVDAAKKAADTAAKEEEDKQSAAAALAEAKKNAETELKLYAAGNGVALEDKSVTDGLKAIGEASDEEKVASALTAAKNNVDAVKKAADDAKKAEEEAAKAEAEKQSAAAALAEAKKNAETELKLYAASNGVALEDKSVTDGLKAIGDAADEQAVTSAMTAAKNNVDAVKKAADDAKKAEEEAAKAEAEKQSAAAALAEAKKNAENDLKLYATNKGVSLDDKAVKDGLSEIASASDESGVATALATATKNVDAANTTQSNGPSGWVIALIAISAVEILIIAALIVVGLIKKKKNS